MKDAEIFALLSTDNKYVGYGLQDAFFKETKQFDYYSLKQLEYKAKAVGINFVVTEERYTLKASFIDNDEIPVRRVAS